MLSTICGDDALEKKRFFVEDAGATWHVDVYDGILNGVVIAEIELKQETQAPTLPSWVGKESDRRSVLQEDQYARACFKWPEPAHMIVHCASKAITASYLVSEVE